MFKKINNDKNICFMLINWCLGVLKTFIFLSLFIVEGKM